MKKKFGGKMILIFLLFSSFLLSIDWEPISKSDWEITRSAKDEDCHAIILLSRYIKDDRNGTKIKYYRRIKILDEKGAEFGKVSISYGAKWANTFKVYGRTIHPDGSIFFLDEKDIYTVNVVKSQRRNYKSTTFILPKIIPGCIIEYIYEHWVEDIDFYTILNFQEEMPVVLSEFIWIVNKFFPFSYYIDKPPKNKFEIILDPPNSNYPKEIKFIFSELPPLLNESFAPPKNERGTTGYFFYIYEKKNSDEFWNEYASVIYNYVENFIKKQKSIEEIFKELKPDITPMEKISFCYYYLQKNIQNTEYLTEEQKKGNFKELKKVKNLDDMFKKGYGSSLQINFAFLAMARNLGFDANIVGVIDRTEKYFKKELQRYEQIDNIFITIKFPDGKNYFFNPGNPFLPFGRINYEFQSTIGLILKDKKYELISIPSEDEYKNIEINKLEIKLNEDFSATCNYNAKIRGQRAFSLFEEYFDKTFEEKKKKVEDRINSFFNEKIAINSYDIKIPDKKDQDLEISCDFSISKIGSQAGNKVLLNPSILRMDEGQMFVSENRINPIIFNYNKIIIDEIIIQLPENFKLESLPENVVFENLFGRYEAIFEAEGNKIKYKRTVKRTKQTLAPNLYKSVKDFFQKQFEYDQLSIVLAENI